MNNACVSHLSILVGSTLSLLLIGCGNTPTSIPVEEDPIWETSSGTSSSSAASSSSNGSSGNGSSGNGSSGNGSSSTSGGMGNPNDPAPKPPDDEAYEGFGAMTPGGNGGAEIHITEATDAAVRSAWKSANDGDKIIVFDVGGPIPIASPLPLLTGNFVTIEGNGVTLEGSAIGATQAMVDIRGHDVIVRNMRLRNAGDNLRAQETGAYNIVFSHISSTGATDDGISIGYGAHDVTVQYCFLAGNTRSMFIKYGGTTNVTLHHDWIMKQWIRGPIVYAAFADVRNIIVEDWTLWGSRFESGGAGGNAVSSLWRLSPFAESLGGKPEASLYAYMGASAGDIYVDDNGFEGKAVPSPSLDGHATQPFAAPPVTTQSRAQMEGIVNAKAGCLPRDTTDQAYIDTTMSWDVVDGKPLRLP